MKRIIILAATVLTTSLLFCASALAINMGDLDETLRISLDDGGCVRPILVLSVSNKMNVYVTGEVIKSAAILRQEKGGLNISSGIAKQRREDRDSLFFEGGVYFDFADEECRGKLQ